MVSFAIVEIAALCAACAVAFCEITVEGELLSWWPRLADYLTPGALRKLRKPLYACAKCQAGSAALIAALASGYTFQAGIAALLAVCFAMLLHKAIY